MHRRTILKSLAAAPAAVVALKGQDPVKPPERPVEESPKVETSVPDSSAIKAGGTPVDFESDLGVSQGQPTFSGKLVFAAARKHKIVVEGTPFRLTGDRDLSRGITYAGRTYTANEHVLSTADLNYFYGGYQYDFLSRDTGHVGVNVGGAWLDATGTIRGQNTGITATKSETIGLPLAGIDARIFPVRKRILVDIAGEVKGMAFGDYGHYVQASFSAGVGIRNMLVEAGYRIVNVDIHTTDNTTGVSPQFTGPTISIIFRIP